VLTKAESRKQKVEVVGRKQKVVVVVVVVHLYVVSQWWLLFLHCGSNMTGAVYLPEGAREVDES